jgi:protein TonB
LAVGATFIIIATLLSLNAPPLKRPQFKGGPILLDLSPEAATAPAAQKTKATAKASPRPPAVQPRPERPLPPVEPAPIPSKNPLPFILLTKEEFAAADIAKLGTKGVPGGARGEMASAAGDTEQVGTAPNGEPLYAAEWYRKPTNAEVSGYLPARMPKEGWGLVACRTAPRYRVEDCVELGSSPLGSRLAGAVRQAAWQFLVRPPRVGGRELVGTWVRIRIEYNMAPRE